jgi:site-specific recombinase XerD
MFRHDPAMTGRPPTEPWPSRLAAFAEHELAVSGLAAATVASHRSYLRALRPLVGAGTSRSRPGDRQHRRPGRPPRRGGTTRHRPWHPRAQAAALHRFYAWLVLTGAADADPKVALALPRVPPLRPELYRPDEVAAVLEHLATLDDPRGRQRQAIVASLRYTGMRSGELRTLRRDQLDLDGARARVRSKGGHPRIVLLPAPLVAILRRFLTEVRPTLGSSPLLLVNPHPYVTTHDGGFGQQTLHREVELAGLGAGVPGRHFPHKWRHTYATELVRRGVDIHVVQRLLGHASISSTLGYVHLALDDLQATVDAIFT